MLQVPGGSTKQNQNEIPWGFFRIWRMAINTIRFGTAHLSVLFNSLFINLQRWTVQASTMDFVKTNKPEIIETLCKGFWINRLSVSPSDFVRCYLEPIKVQAGVFPFFWGSSLQRSRHHIHRPWPSALERWCKYPSSWSSVSLRERVRCVLP